MKYIFGENQRKWLIEELAGLDSDKNYIKITISHGLPDFKNKGFVFGQWCFDIEAFHADELLVNGFKYIHQPVIIVSMRKTPEATALAIDRNLYQFFSYTQREIGKLLRGDLSDTSLKFHESKSKKDQFVESIIKNAELLGCHKSSELSEFESDIVVIARLKEIKFEDAFLRRLKNETLSIIADNLYQRLRDCGLAD